MYRRFAWAVSHILLFSTVAMPESIPATNAETFSGVKVVFPDTLKGKVSILVLSFTEKAGGIAAGWEQKIGRDYGKNDRVAYYELPVLEDVPWLIRPMVIAGIKSQIPSTERPRFVPIVDNSQQWKQLVQYKDADDAYILVLDPSSQIVYRFHGAISDAGYHDFRMKTDALLALIATTKPVK